MKSIQLKLVKNTTPDELEIKEDIKARDLGVIMSELGNFDLNIEMAVNKANS